MFILKQVNCLIASTSRKSVNLVQVFRNFSNASSATKAFTVISPNFLKKNAYQTCATLRSSQNLAPVLSTHDSVSSIQIKKRPVRKKKTFEEEGKKPGIFNVVAFATAEEYDLERLVDGLNKQDLYEPRSIENDGEVVHAVAKYRIEKEPREIFFFKEGSVVLWNITDLESSNVLSFLRQYEQDSYSERLVQSESEIMNYKYHVDQDKPTCLEKSGDFVLAADKENLTLDKYTLSNSMVLSVKLGIWEASLDKYIDEIEFVTDDLKRGKKIKMTREEVLRKHGELFALRHYLNLSSDALDTPDFYWENEQLENLYNQVCVYFCINKRSKVMNEKLSYCLDLIALLAEYLGDVHHTRLEWMVIILIAMTCVFECGNVMNEKINHCVALIELLSTHLSDKHHIRLEWMIIVLIMVEVAFEAIHYIDRYMA